MLGNLKALLLAGGQSTRMGTAKHLLPFIDREPIYLHLIRQLRKALPDTSNLYMSLYSPDQASGLQQDAESPYQIIYDPGRIDAVDKEECVARRMGPAAGLLAASDTDPTAHWLVLACDYPLISYNDLEQLLVAYEEPITCFRNAEGWWEPLVGIWSPQALKQLRQNMNAGITGPIAVVHMLKGKAIRPSQEESLLNTNKRQEWEDALQIARRTADSTEGKSELAQMSCNPHHNTASLP